MNRKPCFSRDPCHHCTWCAHLMLGPIPNLCASGFISWQPRSAAEVCGSEAKVFACKKKNGWSTLRVPPAACHCCVGLASCLLRGLAVLSTTIVPGPESHIFLSSPGCMWAGVSWVPGHLYSLVLWHLSCFGTVTLAVWSQVPKPFLTPSETWEFV